MNKYLYRMGISRYFIFIPNLLSIVRIGLVYPILNNISLGNFQLGIMFFIIAAITDAVDGFLARKMNWKTNLGKILDPVADKLLLSGTIFILWLNAYIPFYIFVIFFSRDVLILVGASIHMSVIESEVPLPNILGKLTTAFQIVYIFLILIFQSYSVEISLILLDILIISITILSLMVYANSWFKSLKTYNNE